MGRPEFENQTMISAVSSSKMVWINLIKTDNMPQNTFMKYVILSPAKTVSRIKNARITFDALVGHIAGDSVFRDMLLEYPGNGNGIFQASCTDPTKQWHFDRGSFRYAGSNTMGAEAIQSTPVDLGALNSNIREAVFDDVIGIQVVFKHSSALTQAAVRREINLWVEQETVSR